MPPTVSVAAFVFGIVFILAALVGKDIEIAAVKIPALSGLTRPVVGIAGILLIYVGLFDPLNRHPTVNTTTTPTPTLATQALGATTSALVSPSLPPSSVTPPEDTTNTPAVKPQSPTATAAAPEITPLPAITKIAFQVKRVRVGLPPDNMRLRVVVALRRLTPDSTVEDSYKTSISRKDGGEIATVLLTVHSQVDAAPQVTYLNDRPDEEKKARELADISLNSNPEELQVFIAPREQLYLGDVFVLPPELPDQPDDLVVIDLCFSPNCPINRR